MIIAEIGSVHDGNFKLALKLIKKSNARLVGFASIIDRSTKKSLKIKNKIVSHLKIDVPSYNLKNIPKTLKSIPITTPGSRFIK